MNTGQLQKILADVPDDTEIQVDLVEESNYSTQTVKVFPLNRVDVVHNDDAISVVIHVRA